MTKEFGVAYYGVMFPDRVDQDFEEMRKHGVNAVLLGVGEYDAWFWGAAIPKIVEKAKSAGFTVYIDLWGWGKVFGGEPPSIFLQDHVEHRQITNKGRVMPAACMNSEEFRQYVFERAERLATETEADYFFLDEPHFSFYVQKSEGYGFRILKEWTCRCEICRAKFREEYGYEMPLEMNEDVLKFREKTIVGFLGELADIIKKADSKKKVAVCLLPAAKLGGVVGKLAGEYKKLIGVVDWDRIAELSSVDMLGTDPYWMVIEEFIPTKLFFKGLKWYGQVVDYLLETARKYGKETQVWVQAFRVPKGREEEIVKGIDLAVAKGVDSIFAWPYRAGMFSVLESSNAAKLWSLIGRAFKKYREA